VILAWRGVEAIWEISWGWGTVSNALLKSIAMAIVLVGGRYSLNPDAIDCVRGSSAEVVEWRGRKPCWVSARGSASVRKGRRRRSSTFTAGHRREIGRYEELLDCGLPGLGMVMIVADFHMAGMSALARDRLKRSVRYWMPLGPKWRRWRMVKESGPVAVEVPEPFTACLVWSGVNRGDSVREGVLVFDASIQ
jgi:hypothetical protein